LIEEDYNFKLLKYVLLDNSIGHTKLRIISLIYRVINYIANCLEDFKIDWRYYNAAVEALLNILIGKHSIYQLGLALVILS
jgi:hypothetical protein